MGKSVSKEPTSTREPLEPTDFFTANGAKIIPNMFGNSSTKETTGQGNFSAKDFKYLNNPTPFDDPDALETVNRTSQPMGEVLKNTYRQFGANVASSIGQGLANTFDLVDLAKTVKGEITGSTDNFQSSLFGLTTGEMQLWANGIAEREPIYEKKEDAFDVTDAGWWAKQVASTGTGIGMAIEALGTTATIEAATGGIGTAAALAKLGDMGRKIMRIGKGAEILADSVAAARGMKSAATVYGIMSRTSEGRMEAMNSYDEIYADLDTQTNKDGQPKFSKEEKEKIASEGARKVFNGNMALLPLDILSYRTMVFNPISGSAEGLLEKALGKIGNKVVRGGVQHSINIASESAEEAGQFIISDEGKHYAKVLAGEDDGSTFGQRLGQDVKKDEFWNNAAGGAIGAPIIGGAMKAINTMMGRNKSSRVSELHDNYLQNVGKMDSDLATKIKQYESEGKTKEAAVARRQFNANRALGALHFDAMADKDTAFDAHITFVNGVVQELNAGKTDALSDLGFTNPTTEQIETVKKEFGQYAKDAAQMKTIYDTIKTKYNRSFVPQITQEHFQLEKLLEEKAGIDATIASQQANLFQYGDLGIQGKEIYDNEHRLDSLKFEDSRLTELYRKTTNAREKENINQLLEDNRNKVTDIVTRINELNGDATYTNSQKTKDNDIISTSLRSKEYLQAIYDKEHLNNEIALQRKNIKLWNNADYIAEKTQQLIQNATNPEQVAEIAATTTNSVVQEQAQEKQTELAAKDAAQVSNQQAKTIGDDDLFAGHNELLNEIIEATAPAALVVDSTGTLTTTQTEATATSTRTPITYSNFNTVKAGDAIYGIDGKKWTVKEIDGNRIVTNEGLDTDYRFVEFFKDSQTTPVPQDTGLEVGQSEGTEPEALFSPASYDFDKSSEDAKLKVKNGVGGLINKLGSDNIFFEDLVRHVIKLQSESVADNLYNALKYGWEANGRTAEDYDVIYAKVFGNPMDELLAGASQLIIQNTQELEVVTQEVIEDVVAHEEGKPDFDTNNQPVYTYKGIITNEASPKMAFATRLTHLIKQQNDDGTVDISYEFDEANLNEDPNIDSLQLLDPDKFNDGTELEIKVPTNFNDIRIPIYSETEKTKYVSFGQYVAENNLSPNSQEYQDKIPMVIYAKGATSSKGIAFVHDIGWYHPVRFNQEFKDDMANAINQTREIRKEVLNSANQSTTASITGKRQTTFAGLKTATGTDITLREANPDAQLTIALTPDTLSTSKSEVAFPNDKSKLINTKFGWTKGQILEVRRFGLKDGVETYVASPILRRKLDQASRISVLQTVAIYADRANKDTAVRAKHDKTIKHIQDTMGLDILSQQGLEKYLKHFINVFNTEKAHTNADVENQAKVKLAAGTPFIAIIAGGNIVMGRAGEPAYVDRNGNKVGSLYINPNTVGSGKMALAALAKPNMIGWYEQNLDLNNLGQNKPVITIDGNFATTQSANSYNDYLLERLRTNIRSVNIGTEDKPNYVTNIQPVVTYDTNIRLQRVSQPQTNTEVREQMVEQTSTQVEEVKQEAQQIDPLKLAEEAIARAKAKLGSDFKNKGNNLFSPAELTTTQREQVASSINRIAGLTPSQQFDITDFMYNQITAMVNLDTKQVTRAEVDKEVDKAWKEIIAPLKAEYKQEIADNKKLLADFPQLAESGIPDVIASYEFRLGKIQSIENSMPILKLEAYNRVAKYTGITEGKIREEAKETNEENPDNKVEEDTNDREMDFWTDVLTESPENKLTYSMRRFFGQVKNVDKKGALITGFLGLPTYVGADTIIKSLMITLADVPSSFDAMIAKLEDRKQALPWMQEVIDKLKDTDTQKRNQFVTVMSNTMLRMKFTMISFNRKTNSWTTKVYDTNSSGTANTIKDEWASNFIDSDLVITDEEKNYVLNVEKATSLINTFKGWKGINIVEVPNELIAPLWDNIVSKVTRDTTITFTPTGALLQTLKTNIVSGTDRMKFTLKGGNFQITNVGNGKFKVEQLKQTVANQTEVKNWLEAFGVTVSPESMEELFTKGLYHNYGQRKWAELFDNGNSNGLIGILYNKLQNLVAKGGALFNEEGGKPLDDTVLNSLANLEAKYNSKVGSIGFRDGKKSIFAISAPKFTTDRVRDLKIKNSEILRQLKQISFSQPSLWLQLLDNDKFREKFSVSHVGLTAFKQLGVKNFRDNSITSLSDTDHELTKLGMFWDTTQGEIDATKRIYPGTNIGMRMATVFSPTMSDKSMMTLITTAVLDLQNKDLGNGEGISDETAKVLYEQTVKPELARMIKFWQNGGSTNISAYDKGAAMFMLMPEMNNIMLTPELKLVDAIKHQPNIFTLQNLEQNKELMDKVYNTVKAYTNKLTQEKLGVWETNGFTSSQTVNGNEVLETKFFDSKYLNKFHGEPNAQVKMAAMDFVVNSMVANANSFMTMAGDPALYYKSKAKDAVKQAKDSFVNVGKRLALLIAPGTTLANSEHEKYIQIFLEDRHSVSENIDYLERLLGKDEAESYKDIEGSDAQEYTTWQEHLNILAKLGKTGDNISDITPQDIIDARAILAGDPKAKLTDVQKKLVGKVMQPIKPVYTGQMYDKEQDVMRTVYIKSSSFPLIPQLTAGFEIDKLRVAMEKIEKAKKVGVRASYQTANKVGSINTPLKVWNDDGTINTDSLTNLDGSTLVLDRKNFRIQQEVPFKSGKKSEDTITLGTQLMKLLFGDEILNYDNFQYNGKSLSGSELHSEYNTAFIKLVQGKRSQLFKELGLDEQGVPVDNQIAMEKLQSILRDEAISRGYPLQDIEGLKMDKDSNFNLPLWSSSNSNRYESMLNAIVSNRLIKMKFPGNSYVVGSEEGFKRSVVEEGQVDTSGIVYTSAWNGSHLTAINEKDGKIKKAQVFVASKFRDRDGNLIDLMIKENGQYKYLESKNGSLFLKDDMFDKELLSLLSFRIPTSGHQSGSQVEIAGFLPHMNGDLMIVPRNFTKQKGLDFDVDKENTYQYWHYMNDNDKFSILNESHRTEILAKADKLKDSSNDSANKFLNSIFGEDIAYTKEEIADDKFLSKLNAKIYEKLLQNQIVEIHNSVFNNPAIQHKVNKTLNTDYAEAQANLIESLSAGKDDSYWTPLSDEYQKSKMGLGSAGKIGTGAYSLDVVGHSLFQQAAINGKPVRLTETLVDGTVENKTWRFGNIESTGELGGTTTLDGGRTISEVMAERQNVAVDNEKLQIMGRVNLNGLTMDVDKIFNMLGFDKGEDGNSISFLFLSQPIIKDYVAAMQNANSNVGSEYSENKEKDIVDGLIAKYLKDAEEVDEEFASELMDNEGLLFEIQFPDKTDGQTQAAVMRRFMEMKDYGIALRGIQTTINTDSKGLGKSFFDVIEKKAALNRIGMGGGLIEGASGLIGDYLFKDDLSGRIDDLKEQGYIDIGNYLVKPDTLSGAFNIMGVTTAYNLWKNYFPYDASVTQMAFDEILPIISKGDVGDSKKIELKQDIFKNIKKYFSTFKKNGIIKVEDDINAERKRLFIDSDDNVSLAKYIKTIKDGNDPVVNQFIKTNKLFNRFEFDLQKDGQPSKIKYNNAAGEEFDEQYLYEALASLIEVRGSNGKIELPTVGNKSYTLDTLAQDLIAYSMLGNSIQEAIQFTKYIPVSYLDAVGYSRVMRVAGEQLSSNPKLLGLNPIKADNEGHLVSEFTFQYIQHNPERVKSKFDAKNLSNLISDAVYTDKKDLATLQSFKKKGTDANPTFIAIYNSSIPKGEKKQQLYWFDGDKYNRIPVLGTFGMDEYQPTGDRNTIGQSLINGRVRLEKIAPQAEINKVDEEVVTSKFGMETGNITTVIKSIADAANKFSPLAAQLLPFINNDLKIAIADAVDEFNNFEGLYQKSSNTITIGASFATKADDNAVAKAIMHEVVHGLTSKQISPYITNQANGNVLVSANAPLYVANLVRLFNDIRSKVDTVELQAVLDRVQASKGITTEERATKYGLTNIDEFIAMAMTEPEFQKYLSQTEFKQSGKSLLDKFKEIISSVLSSLGVKFESDTATAQAINSIFDLIENSNSNKSIDKINSELNEYNYDEDTSFLDHIDDEIKMRYTFINIWAGSNQNANLSNLAKRPFTKDADEFESVEQYYQYQKWNYLKDDISEVDFKYNSVIADKIMSTTNGFELKKLGRQFKALDNQRWDANAEDEMKIAIKLSFEQNDKAKQELLATGNAILTHLGTVRDKWTSTFPRILMEVREEFRSKAQFSPNSFPTKQLDIKTEKCI